MKRLIFISTLFLILFNCSGVKHNEIKKITLEKDLQYDFDNNILIVTS